jgi:cation diffusion facilitator CzcD-associated flavoprotein CzcO
MQDHRRGASSETDQDRTEVLDVAIIGSGFGGLGMAISLLQAGTTNIAVLEKDDGVGGTWRENTYPGAACDVPSHLYSYSFHRFDWSRRYPPQAEILQYIESVVSTFGLAPYLRFGTEVRAAAWDEAQAWWTLTLGGGEQLRARVVVSAVGQLNRPAYPDLEGRDRFQGASWHSARWDHDHDLTGQRVAVIGTGASAIQFVPEVAKDAAAVHVFQRSAPYIIPKPDRPYQGLERALYQRVPLAEKLDRASIFLRGELLTSAILGSRSARANVEKMWRAFLDEEITDPELHAACEPDYVLGCKRILFSNDWYATLARPYVELITDAVTGLTPSSVVTADGREREVDVVVYGTGFQATGFLQPMQVTGRDGRDLHEAWAEGAEAYRGLAVHGFPNLFVLYGPNTNLGGNSILFMLEAQIRYIQQALDQMAGLDLVALDVRDDAQDDFRTWVDATSHDTAWESGCHSWYTTGGRNTNNWPALTYKYGRLVKTFDLFDYDARPRPVAVPETVAASGASGPTAGGTR